MQQRVLFTFYSRPEGQAALGRGARDFSALIEARHPDLRFDWKRLRRALADVLEGLPESYAHGDERLRDRFRRALVAFAKQVLAADPMQQPAAAALLAEQRLELEYVARMVLARLAAVAAAAADGSRRAPVSGGVPAEVEADALDLVARGELGPARAIFGLLVEAYGDYADGWNHLGAIARAEGQVDEAIAAFTKAMEVGRGLFPRRIARRRYGRDEATRPYLRALGNLAMALRLAGRHAEALAVCDRLEGECGDLITGAAERAAIHLDTGRWRDALAAASAVTEQRPELWIPVALSLAELGRRPEALVAALHAATKAPATARRAFGARRHLPHQSPAARRFLRALITDPRVEELIARAAVARISPEAEAQNLADLAK